MSRFYISAAHKSSGKTTLSLGLAAALTQQGLKVQTFKKGPDYIDPMWLREASGRPCYNLDFNTMQPDEIQALVAARLQDTDVGLIEGNKGLFDGMALDLSNSNAALAHLLETPIVLVIDVQGMTRGIAPLLLGYQQFDSRLRIDGVILNKVAGSRHETKLRETVEHYTDIPVVGAVHRNPALRIDERHLGLVPSNEASGARALIDGIAARIQDQVDLRLLHGIAAAAPALAASATQTAAGPIPIKVHIGVARDAAFGFYYPDDLEALEAAGATLVPIDTLSDSALPPIDGLFIGGGFPETCMDRLAANTELRHAIHAAIEAGLPTYAECGGLMYLTRSLRWNERQAEMVGIIPADTVMHPRPQGRGYIVLEEEHNAHPWQGTPPCGAIAAHEFHYSRLENFNTDSVTFAYRVLRGSGIDGRHDGYVYKNLLACYAHLRDTAQYHWATRFVDFVRRRKNPTQHR
ncbi:MAG TPA: cobyrinate a,c-diamide synthase [Thiohalobacter sp.]|nr:cobyrinate a,c-diamide synthase [Thiohalobacter sp.]